MNKTMRQSRFNVPQAAVVVTALTFSALGIAPQAPAQATRPAEAAPTTRAALAEPKLQATAGRAQTIEVIVGESRVLDAAWPVKRVTVADPEIADVDATSPTRIEIRGRAVGVTELGLESEQGEIWRARLSVNADTSRLQGQLRKLFANSSLEITQVDDVVVVKGTLARAEDAAQMRQLLVLSKLDYLDLTSVAGLQQVQLQVKVAEVSRTGLRFLSADFAFTDGLTSFASNAGASGTYNPTTPAGNFARNLPGGTTIFGTGVIGGGNLFEYFIKALSENQYLRLLAEPTLVARSGQEAQFLAGGEIPIPVAQVGGAERAQISIEYKEFGVRLQFTPTVLGDGRIELKVRPEISQLSDVGAIEILGTRIPSLLTRRVETTLELQSGQTFAIAGLLHQNENANVSRIPLLGDLPVLGTLFRSVRYSREDTEMVVLVTASLVEPSSNELNPPVPGDFHVEPNDWELYVEGRFEGRHTVRVAPAQRERLKRLGLDQLHGPGAWASHDDASNNLAGDRAAKKK
ncbi:MAG: type II and III secretion system protein family protein [Tepidisphaeraceae bacterium]